MRLGLRGVLELIPYFAYGSNLCKARLSRRVRSVETLGVAWLDGHRIAWHKRSSDGSGKCDAVATGDPSDQVRGALFAFDERDSKTLDAAEARGYGYERRNVTVMTHDGPREAFTYIADGRYVDPDLLPYDWYKRFVIEGARQQGLPAEYVKALGKQPTRRDPDRKRAEENSFPCWGW